MSDQLSLRLQVEAALQTAKALAQSGNGERDRLRGARAQGNIVTAADVLQAHHLGTQAAKRDSPAWLTPLARELAMQAWSPFWRSLVAEVPPERGIDMVIGQVIGTVVASRKHERLVGSKIQIVQPLGAATCSRKASRSWRSMRSAPESANRC